MLRDRRLLGRRMYPVLYESSTFTLYTHNAITVLAYTIGIGYAAFRWKKLFGSYSHAISFLIVCLVATRIGGRAINVLENLPFYIEYPISAFKLWESGFGSLGSWVFTIAASIGYARVFSLPTDEILDFIVVPTGMLSHGLGRLACLASGDVYGKVTSSPLAIVYTNQRSSIPDIFLGFPLHPLPIYMSCVLLVLFVVSLKLRKSQRYGGQTASTVLLCFAIARFFIEFLRSDYSAVDVIWGLNSSQITCAALFAGSLVAILCLHRRHEIATSMT